MGLVEVLVAMTLLVLAVAMFGSALTVVRASSERSQDMGAVTDQARLALNQLERQIRFGYWVRQETPPPTGSSQAITVLTSREYGELQCWTWAIDAVHGRLMSYVESASTSNGPPPLPVRGWHVAAGPEEEGTSSGEVLIDPMGSHLVATTPVAPLNPVTFQRVLSGLYRGADAEVSISKGSGPAVILSFSVTTRNMFLGAHQVAAGAPSYADYCR